MEKAAPCKILKTKIISKLIIKINNSDEKIIMTKAMRDNNFFPYLSIKVEVYGVSNIEEKPKVDITMPISDFE